MATQTTELIDRDLTLLLADVVDLPELAQQWANLNDGVRASLSLEWDQSMAVLRSQLEPAYRSGRMTTEQRRRYQKLIHKLKESLPLIKRMALEHPAVTCDPS